MILISKNQPLSMSSREIAILVNSRHDKVKQSIERLALRGVIGLPPMGDVKNQSGQTVSVYFLEKRDSYVVVAQLSPEFTADLVDRWQELEEAQKPQIPQTYGQALQLAADQAKQLEEQAPKVAVYEQLADRRGDVSTTLLSKQLDGCRSAIQLNKWLREHGIKMLAMDAPKAGYGDWFNVVSDVKNGHEFTQCLITPEGQIEIAKLWADK